MSISSFPIVMFAVLLTLSGAAYSVGKKDIFSQNTRATDPIVFSQQSLNNLASYQVMMRPSSPSDESKIIRYSFQKSGYVWMDFTQSHSGVVLIFNPASGKVTLQPFGVGSLPILYLSSTNSLIQDERGHRVDRSDTGVLLDNTRHLRREGTTTTVGKESLAGRATTRVSVAGPGTIAADGVYRYDVWLDNYHGPPAKVVNYASDGQRLETVFLDAMVINICLPANFFSP